METTVPLATTVHMQLLFPGTSNPVVSAQASHLFAAIAARQVEMQATVDAIPGVVHGDDIGAIVPTNGKTRAFGATQNLIDLLTAQYPTLILTHKKSHPFGVN